MAPALGTSMHMLATILGKRTTQIMAYNTNSNKIHGTCLGTAPPQERCLSRPGECGNLHLALVTSSEALLGKRATDAHIEIDATT